ncbi:hypothetical protein CWE09_03610 [Aliidiomarina minuta]|uniref:Anti-sigma-E factor RseA n=1 Tax=Aliidiomarina minuta TaxID=880057 RepID=A0A432W6Y3_9GAMM|nr:RseA family anti-sigma factor [Aliidiomarina minuta]RUO25828.1 hypothetical protein CWE09_03610 [Aliidiomarina minuta]
MTDKHNEHLSALIDSEDLDERVLERMLTDDEQKSTWQRYQLVGAVIRDEARPGMAIDISASVAAQVAEEPAIAAPKTRQSWLKPAANDSWWRPAASFAVAASVALVTVIGVTSYQMSPTGELPSQRADATSSNPIFETNPLPGFASPVSFNSIQESPRTEMDSGTAQRRQLQSYFIDHQQQLQLSHQHQEEQEPLEKEQAKDGSN